MLLNYIFSHIHYLRLTAVWIKHRLFLQLAKLHRQYEVDNLKKVEVVNFVTYITILENHIGIKIRYHYECVDYFSTTPNPKILFLLKEYSWIIRVGNAFELEVLKDEK